MMSIVSSSIKYVRNSFRNKDGASNDAQNTTDYVTNYEASIFEVKSVSPECAEKANAAGQIAFDAVKKHGFSDELANEARYTAMYNSLHPFDAEVGLGSYWNIYLTYRSFFVECGMRKGMDTEYLCRLSTHFPGLDNMGRNKTELTYDGLTKLKTLW